MNELTSQHKSMIRSNPIKALVGAYEHGNGKVLDYALSIATEPQKIKARQKAMFAGFDIDMQASDVGEEMKK